MFDKHFSVLKKEVTKLLVKEPLNTKTRYIDATLGAGGHTRSLLEAGVDQVLGLETDPKMLEIAKANLSDWGNKVIYKSTNFVNIRKSCEESAYEKVDGIIADLGISQYHYLWTDRGFSVKDENAKLDMRLNSESQAITAAQLLNVLREDQLLKLFETSMTYREARAMAKNTVRFRSQRAIETVKDLVEISSKMPKNEKRHQATKAFMSLRIAVNNELENIDLFLPQAIDLLKNGGRLAVISFHSTEDKRVNDFFSQEVKKHNIKVVTKKPITATAEELSQNPSSRSALLRVVEKI